MNQRVDLKGPYEKKKYFQRKQDRGRIRGRIRNFILGLEWVWISRKVNKQLIFYVYGQRNGCFESRHSIIN